MTLHVFPLGSPAHAARVSAIGLPLASTLERADVVVLEPGRSAAGRAVLFVDEAEGDDFVPQRAIDAVAQRADAYAGDAASLVAAAQWACTVADTTSGQLALRYLGSLGERRPHGAPAIGDAIPIERPITLGRSDSCDIRLRQGAHSDQNTVARVHARVEPLGDGARVIDLASSNGTYVGGERIGSEARVKVGDEIAIAWSHRFRVVLV